VIDRIGVDVCWCGIAFGCRVTSWEGNARAVLAKANTSPRLREMEIESEHVGNLGMAAFSDSEILDEGRKRDWVVVTLDADFHALLTLSAGCRALGKPGLLPNG